MMLNGEQNKSINFLYRRIELMQYQSRDDKCPDAGHKRRYATQAKLNNTTKAEYKIFFRTHVYILILLSGIYILSCSLNPWKNLI